MSFGNKSEHRNRGHAVLELALTLPVLIALVFGGLEFARVLDRLQWVTALSREAANVISRRCAHYRDPNSLTVCVEARISELTAKSAALAPGTSIMAAIFSYDEAAANPISLEYQTTNAAYNAIFTGAAGLGFDKTLLQQQITAGAPGSVGMALREHDRITAAAVFIPYAPLLRPFFAWAVPRQLYSSTVM